MQQIIPAIILISVFLYLSSKKKEEKTPLLIFTKTKHFLQTQIFEKLRESCGNFAGIQNIKINSIDILLEGWCVCFWRISII